MKVRDLDDVAVELRGIAATLSIMSGAFLFDDLKADYEVIADSVECIADQIRRLGDEVAHLALPQKKNCLKELRTVRGISLEELGKLTGISEGVLSEIENGQEVELNTRSVVKLAEVLKVLPSEIFPN